MMEDVTTIDQDTRAGLASVLEEITEGLAEVYGFKIEDIKQRLITPADAPNGLFEIFAILYAIQGFLLDESDEVAVHYLVAAAMALEPVVFSALGTDSTLEN
jgi:hypothetical protein